MILIGALGLVISLSSARRFFFFRRKTATYQSSFFRAGEAIFRPPLHQKQRRTGENPSEQKFPSFFKRFLTLIPNPAGRRKRPFLLS